MTIKPIKSTDPQKAKVVSAFKWMYNCRKVTNVRSAGDDRYIADCMNFCAATAIVVLRDRRIRWDHVKQTWQIDYSNPGVEQ